MPDVSQSVWRVCAIDNDGKSVLDERVYLDRASAGYELEVLVKLNFIDRAWIERAELGQWEVPDA